MTFISKVCNLCSQSKQVELFPSRGRQCRSCVSKRVGQCIAARKRRDPRYRILLSSKNNANAHGIEHTLTLNDIHLPLLCKYLRIPLNYQHRNGGRAFDAPSIDRIDSSKGYVPGNIQIISDLANRMKQDATMEQLLDFAESVLYHHGSPKPS